MLENKIEIRTSSDLIAERDSGREIDMKSKILLIFSLLPAIAFADNFKETRTLELPAAGVHELSVRCGAGGLTVQGIEGIGIIKVMAEVESEGGDKGEFQLLTDKLVKLDLKREYDKAVLHSDILEQPFENVEARINLQIVMPGKMNLQIVDGSGGIVVKNILGDLKIDDDSGAIQVENITGRIFIKDGSGDIAIEGVNGSIEIDDGSGEIQIQNAAGDVMIKDTSGAIEINDIGGNVTVSDGSGSIDIYRVQKNVYIREAGSGKLEVDGVQGKVIIRNGEEKANEEDQENEEDQQNEQ
jgi:hypothetical protein